MSRSSTKLAQTKLAQAQRIRLNSTHAYVEDKSKGAMLRFQESLPRLPVPSLEETAAKYLRSIRALATPEQYAKTEAAVKEFVQKDGVPLQKKLLERAAHPEMKNWISEWWNSGAYLDYKDPVVPYVSYFFAFKDDKLRKNPAKRAAALTSAALTFKHQVDSGSLEPEYMRKNPICMDAYQWMFNACRVPVKGGTDYPIVYPADGHKHIIVIRKNRFYKVLHEVDGKELTTAELEQQFAKVYELAQTHALAVGTLTSQNRDVWGHARDLLLAAGNEAALKEIESASFVVCLDEQEPVTREERAHAYWHGDGKNRFYDKPAQFIVNDNGAAGFMGEHSMMDGTQTHRLSNYVNDVIFNSKIELGTSVRSSLPEPQEITFNLTGEIEQAINSAQAAFDAEIAKHELAVFNYQGHGKNLIKKFKASPDAYVQMLIQLAYYKLNGVSRPTYESAATRGFQLGRTETCRSVSLESVAFCKAMEDPTVPVAEKLAAARKAINAHVKYISDASDGKGVDRHFFGLKKFLDPSKPVPALYEDPMFAYSCNWYLSTSQLSSEYFNGYGWSQVIDDGFGCAYMINNDHININVVSKKVGSEKLKYYLNEAADDLAAVFGSELKESAKL
ncbi:carnitine O-acetyltransferase, mitochondrial [Trichomonascus vanleenenianus]|uniref:carnitine O-acetyltransferase CAT2 n=1 Tax=Trichomonascus vanleenenianus TaxID=2268995 RepID=UPI003ECA2DA3